jgi:hypothetical protein
MAINPAQIDYDRLVRAYIKAATGLSYVIPGNANSPAPTDPYASVLLITDSSDGFSYNKSIYNDANGNFDNTTFDSRRLTYSIQIYRSSNSMGIARGLAYYHSTPNGRYELQKNGLVVINWNNPINTDLLTDGEFESRATIEMTFGLISSTDQIIERLIEVTINSDISDGENDINDIITVTE